MRHARRLGKFGKFVWAAAAVVLATAAAVGALAAGAPDGGVASAAPEAAKPQSPNVRIILTVIPSTKKAMVFWGKKKLGPIAPHQPLIFQRPRDSGPLDLVVRAEGCLPVQTRVYTFADTKLPVKVTPLEQKNTLLGYREELPPDGGVPPAQNPDAGAP
jgi:hypothetical protein